MFNQKFDNFQAEFSSSFIFERSIDALKEKKTES